MIVSYDQNTEWYNLKFFSKINTGPELNLIADTDRLDKRVTKQRDISVLPMAVTRHCCRLCRVLNRSVVTFRRPDFAVNAARTANKQITYLRCTIFSPKRTASYRRIAWFG